MFKRKTILGTCILITICLLPLIPWYFNSPVRTLDLNYRNITHNLGQIAALVGMNMFAMTFVLSTRFKFIEKLLGGLDRVYKVHSLLGSGSLLLLLLHPIMLVLKFIPERLDLAARYLLLGNNFSVDLGIIALSGMIILIFITFYVNIKYHYWKISHKFLGLFFIIAIFHIFLVRGSVSRDYIFEGYYIYATIVSIIGIFAMIYSIFFKSIKSEVYKVSSIQKHNNAVDIKMIPVSKPLKYKAGQFAFFRFKNKKLGPEFHPFSIASSSNNNAIRIVSKNLGDYTANMNKIKVSDKVTVEGPYGEFTIKDDSEMIWFAGGIGITPFIGMASDLLTPKHNKASSILYYCTKNESELIAFKDLKQIEHNSNFRFKVIPWCSDIKGRISLQKIKMDNENVKIYICGPAGFKQTLLSQLKEKGISKENIYEEDFLFK